MRALGFANPAAEAVLAFCKQAASHSVLASGDGTTSTIVLASEIANSVQKSGSKWPQAFARQIEKSALRAVEAIQKEAIRGDDIVRQVALTSTNGDEELTDVVLEAVSKSSAFGAIVVEKNPASKVRYKIMTQDGYSHCSGYSYNNTLAWSASDRAASNEPIEWTSPGVVVFNGNLLVERQLDPILAAWNNRINMIGPHNLVIVAYELGDEIANKLLVVNRTLARKAGCAAFVVKPRLSAEINSGLQVVRDIASFCGIAESNIVDGGNYKEITAEMIGSCEKIKITPTNTVFMGRGEKHWVDARIHQNLKIADEARAQVDRELTTKRNAQLTEGLVKVEVGDGLLSDLQERADRFDDASKAAQACMRNGALPGCGASYIRAADLVIEEFGETPANLALREAFRVIHQHVMSNYGSDTVIESGIQSGTSVRLDELGPIVGSATELGVLDSTDTVCAVIKNATDLGVKIAILGGYSLREALGSVIDDG